MPVQSFLIRVSVSLLTWFFLLISRFLTSTHCLTKTFLVLSGSCSSFAFSCLPCNLQFSLHLCIPSQFLSPFFQSPFLTFSKHFFQLLPPGRDLALLLSEFKSTNSSSAKVLEGWTALDDTSLSASTTEVTGAKVNGYMQRAQRMKKLPVLISGPEQPTSWKHRKKTSSPSCCSQHKKWSLCITLSLVQ